MTWNVAAGVGSLTLSRVPWSPQLQKPEVMCVVKWARRLVRSKLDALDVELELNRLCCRNKIPHKTEVREPELSIASKADAKTAFQRMSP